MKRFSSRSFLFALAVLVCVGLSVGSLHALHAQVTAGGVQSVSQAAGLSTVDPRVIAVRIINIALGLLATIMVAIMVYSGFEWMTSGGDTKGVEKAKHRIRNAIIGLIIILSSWAITVFVINRLLGATQGGGGGVNGGQSGFQGGFGGGGGSTDFNLRSITPSGSIPLRNVEVRLIFSRSIDPVSASTTIQVIRTKDNVPVSGTLIVEDAVMRFIPLSACPAPNQDRRCFDGNTEFLVRVGASLRSLSGQAIACGGLAPACEGKFQTGNLIDMSGPSVSITSPFDGQSVAQNTLVHVTTQANDDSGIAYIESFVDNRSFGLDTPSATPTPRNFSGAVDWDTSGFSTGTHTLLSAAHDIDSNVSSSSIRVVLRPAHCFNTQKDADEFGVDCGGSECGACPNGQCRQNADCSSGFCGQGGICIVQPVITDFQPRDGRPGTFVSIAGANFGSQPGRITFAPGVAGAAPDQCAALSVRTWTPTNVVVALPPGAQNGPIQILNAESNLSDSTADDRGLQATFTVNDVAHPGLCAADPAHAKVGDQIRLIGAGLGSSSDKVFFQDRIIDSFLSWADQEVRLNVPVVSPASYAVKARSAGADSNAVPFTVDERAPTGLPVVDSVDPGQGPVGEYLTLSGRNFGSAIGSVKFRDKDGNEGLGDISFPAACSQNFWQDQTIIVKVPKSLNAQLGSINVEAGKGPYQITIVRQDGVRSNTQPFTVNQSAPKPGICSISPDVGPTKTSVTLIGERFGESSDQVMFRGTGGAIAAVIQSAKAGELKVSVPESAITGQVQITTAAKAVSNAVNFTVQNCNANPIACGKGQICCKTGVCVAKANECPSAPNRAEYAWRTSTGQIPLNPRVVEECIAPPTTQPPSPPPSPSPWNGRNGGNAVCVNAELVVRFNTMVTSTSINAQTILVRRCTAGGPNPCTQAEAVDGDFTVNAVDNSASYVTFHPKGGSWQASSIYDIVLRKDIRSDSGIPMLEDAARCGTGNGYCFRFQTRDTTDACSVGFVTVAPHPFTANHLGQTIRYRANALASNDFCLQLNSSALNWDWYTGTSLQSPDGRASITNPNPNPPGHDMATGTAIAETGPQAVKINAQILNPDGKAVRGIGDLFARLEPPQIEAFGPNCDQACQNAAIWIKFNVGMDPKHLDPNQIVIKRCHTENCRSFDGTLETSRSNLDLITAPAALPGSPLNYAVFEPTCTDGAGKIITCFTAGQFYKVIVRGGTQSFVSGNGGLPLVGLNDPDGFAWSFRVKSGDNARCAANRITVTPAEKIETVVGARQSFHAQPIGSPSACNAGGEPLVSDQSYTWNSSDQTVAKLLNGGALDTTAELPSHCSGRCLETGADGTDGRVASCGNGLVETTDPHYCQSGGNDCKPGDRGCKTPYYGDKCLVLLPGSKAGEECDLGANNGPQGLCSSSCLWNSVIGGTCGNAIIDRGEECDPGKTCSAGSILGRACTTNDDCGLNGVCSVLDKHGCSATCQLLGSRTSGSVCGNGSIGDGEACDDGNTQSGDGCSADCLHEGSKTVVAVCGNGKLEPGETCEQTNGLWPGGCSLSTCLHVGLQKTCDAPGDRNCCGNGDPSEAGKDCDNGFGRNVDGSGCSSICLLEGSSPAYPSPSFCGDGVIGTGEQCEANGAGDGLIDPDQLAEITGSRQPDVNGRMSTQIQATYDSKLGKGVYGLQCGFTQESSCPGGYGLTAGGCCAPRPTVSPLYPANNEKDVCRNALIAGTFNIEMDKGSFTNNAYLAQEYPAQLFPNGCPTGTTALSQVPLALNGWRGWLVRLWHGLEGFFKGTSAEAAPWCVGSTPVTIAVENIPQGGGQVSRATLLLGEALATSTKYRVVFRGDNNLADSAKQGVKSLLGVVNQADPDNADSGQLTWSFTTGQRLCSADDLSIQDTATSTTPYFFTKADERHVFEATVQSRQGIHLVPLSAIPGVYNWQWNPWVSSDGSIVSASGTSQTTVRSQAEIVSQPKNGSPFVTAGIKITQDVLNVPSSVSSTLSNSRVVNVLLCENPWPARNLGPFTDAAGSASLKQFAPLFTNGPYFNFSLGYCRDAGSATTTLDDLPALTPNPVPLTAFDQTRGILRQYLFTFEQDALKGDGVGIRIATNPLHLSPAAWYESQGFRGSPQTMGVDGYEAIKDGSTVYVAATNVEAAAFGDVQSLIYILSRNPDAKPETAAIFDQLVKNWVFNINLARDSQNVCVYAGNKNGQVTGDYYVRQDPQTLLNVPVSCTADWECAKYDLALRCASLKAKVMRDAKRLADFQTLSDSLESARVRTGSYPTLSTGTFLQTLSTSRWPSWQFTFGAAAGALPPQDPINKFLSCGFCKASPSTICTADSDCGAEDTCVSSQGYDPATCWNATSTQFQCAKLIDGTTKRVTVSRVYQYRAVNGGKRYELSTELEGPDPTRYKPSLTLEVRVCSNTGSTCKINADCDIKDNAGKVVSSGTCDGTGGSWIYQNYCSGTPIGPSGVCGDGVLNLNNNEVCELGETHPAACTVNGQAGTKMQICSDCKGFVDSPNTVCLPNVLCGNGRVDQGESCDDGALNGTYGHCARDCRGLGAVCGDGQLSVGEVCDNGFPQSRDPGQVLPNGQYCGLACNIATSCNVECSGPAGYCGNGKVEPPELCDGTSQTTQSAICVGGSNNLEPCTDTAKSSDCPGGGKCGNNNDPKMDQTYMKCTEVAYRCTNDSKITCDPKKFDRDCNTGLDQGRCVGYPTYHTRTCNAPGDPAQCAWPSAGWSVCLPQNFCGDGNLDPGETCDDGQNNSDSGRCTKTCQKNVCGDGKLFSSQNGGIEECDYGSGNNTGKCLNQADYASSCVGCSPSCRFVASSGGYCGDGIKNGPEQCDGKDTPQATCQTLGFDYAANSTVTCLGTYPYCLGKNGKLAAIQEPVLFDPNQVNVFTAECQRVSGTIVPDSNDLKTLDGYFSLVCKNPPKQVTDEVSCTNKCTLTGCRSCQDDPGTGVINGQVFDAVYSNQPVPGARVTLYLHGQKVSDTFTDASGKFSFEGMNTRPECSLYRLTVDFNQDNPCTADATSLNRPKNPGCNGAPPLRHVDANLAKLGGAPDYDESKHGGYWPYELDNFNSINFRELSSQGKLYLAPRVGPQETLVLFSWQGDMSTRPIDMYLELAPPGYAYCVRNQDPGCNNYPDICSQLDGAAGPDGFPIAADRIAACKAPQHYIRYTCKDPLDPNCKVSYRIVSRADNSLRYLYDLNILPNANIHCFDANGKEAGEEKIANGHVEVGCSSAQISAQAIRYKRGPWSPIGQYNVFLVDRNNGGSPQSYIRSLGGTVRVVTEDQIYTLTPPRSIVGGTCINKSLVQARYWLPFQQDAASGRISLTNQALCDDDAVPGESPNTKLPNPLF